MAINHSSNSKSVIPMGLPEYMALLFLAVVWSSAFTMIKVVVQTVDPFTLATARLFIAAAFLFLIGRLRGIKMPTDIASWGIFFVVGLLGNAIPFSLIGFGEIYVDSGRAAILMGIMPIITIILAYFFNNEDLNIKRVSGILLAFMGVVLLVGIDTLTQSNQFLLAQTAVLLGGVCYGVTNIFVRRFGRHSNIAMSQGACIAGAIGLLPISLIVEQPWKQEFPDFTTVLAILYLAILSTAIAAMVYFWLIRRAGASNTAQVNYVIPCLGVIWGMVFLQEQPGMTSLIALIMIVTGVMLVTYKRRTGIIPPPQP